MHNPIGRPTARPSASARTGITTALTLATTGAALLAIDNLLGFVGSHLIPTSLVPVVAAAVATAGSAAALGAAVARNVATVILAAGIVGFVAVLSPATPSHVWTPVEIALQAGIPIAFAAAGVLTIRGRSASRALRGVAALLVGCAAVWAVTAFVPVTLAVFLIAQATTLLVTAALTLRPLLRRARRVSRALWSSADIR